MNTNIFKELYLIIFRHKYGRQLERLFGINEELENYQELLTFPRKKVKKVLKTKNITPVLASRILFDGKIPDYNPDEAKIITNIRKHALFYQITSMFLSEFSMGYLLHLNYIYENNLTREHLRQVYEIYKKEIIKEYLEDNALRKKTTLVFDSGYRDYECLQLEDHTKYYEEKELNTILEKFFHDKTLKLSEKVTLIGILAKIVELINFYKFDYLIENIETVKKEINVGLFSKLLKKDNKISYDKRYFYRQLAKVFSKNSIEALENLPLLRERLESLPLTSEKYQVIKRADRLLNFSEEEIVRKMSFVKQELADLYSFYEIYNRKSLINNILDPEKSMIITDLREIKEPMLLHFFNQFTDLGAKSQFFDDKEKQIRKLNSYHYILTKEDKENLEKEYQIMQNELVSNYALPISSMYYSSKSACLVNNSNQLSSMILTLRDILNEENLRSLVAIGFSKKNLSEELIAIISAHNLYSNQGIDFIDSENEFLDFSASLKEMLEPKKGFNNEVVLYRNNDIATLKPSYVVIIAPHGLEEDAFKENYQELKLQMNNIGLNCPILIIDIEKIIDNEFKQTFDDNLSKKESVDKLKVLRK